MIEQAPAAGTGYFIRARRRIPGAPSAYSAAGIRVGVDTVACLSLTSQPGHDAASTAHGGEQLATQPAAETTGCGHLLPPKIYHSDQTKYYINNCLLLLLEPR